MANWIIRARFASLAGVSAVALGKACKNGLKPAIKGRVIDADHALCIAYVKKHAESKSLKMEKKGLIEIPEDIESFLDMTLREIAAKFGTEIQFSDWLTATGKIEMINEKRLKNAISKGILISRHLVQVGVIDVFNTAHLRLLKDGSKTIVAGVISKHSTGAELATTEAFVTDILGSFIKPIKAKISRSMKDKISRSMEDKKK